MNFVSTNLDDDIFGYGDVQFRNMIGFGTKSFKEIDAPTSKGFLHHFFHVAETVKVVVVQLFFAIIFFNSIL